MAISAQGSFLWRSARPWVPAAIAAAAIVLPLILPLTWGELHFSPTTVPSLLPLLDSERPLSVRLPVGTWTLGLGVGWFAAAVWRRDSRWWELLLVLVGCLLAVLRIGNVWVSAILLAPPLARQLHQLKLPVWLLAGLTAVGIVGALVLWNAAKPPTLPASALLALNTAGGSGEAIAHLPWASQVQAALTPRFHVLGAQAPWEVAENSWQAYINVAIGRWDWEQQLADLQAELVVIDPVAWPVLGAHLRRSPAWHIVLDRDGVLIAQRGPA